MQDNLCYPHARTHILTSVLPTQSMPPEEYILHGMLRSRRLENYAVSACLRLRNTLCLTIHCSISTAGVLLEDAYNLKRPQWQRADRELVPII